MFKGFHWRGGSRDEPVGRLWRKIGGESFGRGVGVVRIIVVVVLWLAEAGVDRYVQAETERNPGAGDSNSRLLSAPRCHIRNRRQRGRLLVPIQGIP